MRFLCLHAVLLLTLSAPASGQVPDSLQVLEAAVAQSPEDGDAWVRLGHACLDARELQKAEKAFRKGVEYAGSAAAHNGLGLVFMRRNGREHFAFKYFRSALKADPSFVQAQMNIALTHLLLEDRRDAEKALMRALEIDSTYAPAQMALSELRADGEGAESPDEIYRPLTLSGGGMDELYRLALTYLKDYRYAQALKIAERALVERPNDARWLPAVAQARAAQGDFDGALELFELYLNAVPEHERAHYEDLSLVAFPGEMEEYRSTSPGEREAFLSRFWQKRDLMLTSGGRARRAEHYRRVWYALTYLSEAIKPWDPRGEVYVRYGKPDFRSTSGGEAELPSLAVESVKERSLYDIYGAEEAFDMSGAMVDPAYPVRPLTENGMMPHWESWVYTQLDRGVEIVFVDPFHSGRWEFAPVPDMGEEMDLRQLGALSRRNPAFVMRTLEAKTPEYYDMPPGIERLEFYYDLASFRADGDRVRVEVYYGVPPEQVTVERARGRFRMRVKRTVVLADRAGETVHRKEREHVFVGPESSLSERGSYVADIASLEVPPGDYRLVVQLADRASGKWGLYQQEITVPAFAGELAISDLEFAWVVSDVEQHSKYQKGDVWVIPMPTRSYRQDQSVYVYYEVYNLQRDAFGQTRYRVDYAIQHDTRIRWGAGVVGAVGRMFRKLLSSGKPQVSVSYERVGTDAWEPIYLELDTGEMKPGINQIEVTVTDLNSEQTASRKAMFRLDSVSQGERVSREQPEEPTPREPEPPRPRRPRRRF